MRSAKIILINEYDNDGLTSGKCRTALALMGGGGNAINIKYTVQCIVFRHAFSIAASGDVLVLQILLTGDKNGNKISKIKMHERNYTTCVPVKRILL